MIKMDFWLILLDLCETLQDAWLILVVSLKQVSYDQTPHLEKRCIQKIGEKAASGVEVIHLYVYQNSFS